MKQIFITIVGVALITWLQLLPTPPLIEEKHYKQMVRLDKLETYDIEVKQTLAKVPVSSREIGQQEAEKVGWTGEQWVCLERLWTNESGWRETAQNPTSTAYGIAQFLDSTWRLGSYTRTSDPRTQIKAGIEYIQITRYKTPCNALSFWNNQSPNWY